MVTAQEPVVIANQVKNYMMLSMQALQYAEHPQFVESKGLSSPGGLLEMLRDCGLLSDAAISACVGRPIGWHSLWHNSWGGKRSDDTFKKIDDAHLQLVEKVCRPNLDLDLDFTITVVVNLSPLQIYRFRVCMHVSCLINKFSRWGSCLREAFK